jgi:hypothetical protein
LTFARNPSRSRLSLQERELNVFIILSRSNHNYENFTVGSYQIGLGRISGHLASGHFGSWIVSGRVRSGIRSSSVMPFWVSGRIMSGRVGYRVISGFRFRFISGRVGSGIGSSSVGSFRISGRIRSDRVGYQIVQCQVILSYG